MIGPMAIVAVVVRLSASVGPVHGEGVLTPDRGTVAAGEPLELKGARFEPGEGYVIKLVGVLQEFTLATATPTPDSTFTLSVRIPTDAGEGLYRVEAVAPDGDVSASFDLTVTAAEAPAGAVARADEVPINRDRTGAGWAVIGALIGLAAGLGIGLLSSGRVRSAGG